MNEFDVLDSLFKILWLPLGLILGWMFKMIADLRDDLQDKVDQKELDKLEEEVHSKADKDDMKEIKGDVKQILAALTEIKVEQARWHVDNRERK